MLKCENVCGRSPKRVVEVVVQVGVLILCVCQLFRSVHVVVYVAEDSSYGCLLYICTFLAILVEICPLVRSSARIVGKSYNRPRIGQGEESESRWMVVVQSTEVDSCSCTKSSDEESCPEVVPQLKISRSLLSPLLIARRSFFFLQSRNPLSVVNPQ